MADRTAKYNQLPAKLKQVDTALKEMNEVITGGVFDQAKVWGASAEADISNYMDTLTVDAGVKTQINNLLQGLPGSSEIKKAIDAVTQGVQKVIDDLRNQASELGVGNRIEAFNNLNTPHDASPGYDYTPTDNKYGFFPSLTGVINAAAGTNFDLNAVVGPLQTVAAVAAAADGMADFTEYALSSIQLLGKALTVS